jgi:hypothetical protein
MRAPTQTQNSEPAFSAMRVLRKISCLAVALRGSTLQPFVFYCVPNRIRTGVTAVKGLTGRYKTWALAGVCAKSVLFRM